MRRDEVLEHREALHEVGLDRPLDDLALRVGHEAAHPGELADLVERASGARVGHHEDGVRREQVGLHRVGDLVGRLRPDRDDALLALFLGHQAALVLALDLRDLLLVAGEDLLLRGRDHDVVLRDGDPGACRVLEGERLDRVEHRRDRVGAVLADEPVDERVELPLRERAVDDERHRFAVLDGVDERQLELALEDHAPGRREAHLVAAPVLDGLLQRDLLRVERELHLILARVPRQALHLELLRELLGRRRREVVLAVGEVVGAEHHVLRRRRERAPVGRREDVVRRQHQDPRLRLRLGAEREVDRHLVAVEVGVERVADERVHLDRLALDEHRLERLDPEAVERRGAVQEHRMLGDDLLEHVPDLRDHRLDVLLRRLDVLDGLPLDEPAHDERLEELERHQLRQARTGGASGSGRRRSPSGRSSRRACRAGSGGTAPACPSACRRAT